MECPAHHLIALCMMQTAHVTTPSAPCMLCTYLLLYTRLYKGTLCIRRVHSAMRSITLQPVRLYRGPIGLSKGPLSCPECPSGCLADHWLGLHSHQVVPEVRRVVLGSHWGVPAAHHIVQGAHLVVPKTPQVVLQDHWDVWRGCCIGCGPVILSPEPVRLSHRGLGLSHRGIGLSQGLPWRAQDGTGYVAILIPSRPALGTLRLQGLWSQIESSHSGDLERAGALEPCSSLPTMETCRQQGLCTPTRGGGGILRGFFWGCPKLSG